MINTDIGRDGGVGSKLVFALASPFTKSIAQGFRRSAPKSAEHACFFPFPSANFS
jgi:hypothetical protein